MTIQIFGNDLDVEVAPVHIAPGGSVLCTLKGDASQIAAFLRNLREEIAWGMASCSILSMDFKTVSVDLYFGKADRDDFDRIWNLSGKIDIVWQDLPENIQKMGYSMRSRNQIIDALG